MEQANVNWQDKYIDKISSDMDGLKGMESRLMSYMDNNFKRLDNRMDNLELRMERMELKHSEEIRDLKTNIENVSRHTQNLATAAIVGIGAISISVLGVMITVIIAFANNFYK